MENQKKKELHAEHKFSHDATLWTLCKPQLISPFKIPAGKTSNILLVLQMRDWKESDTTLNVLPKHMEIQHGGV